MGNTSLFKHMIRQPEIVSWVSRNTQSTSMIFSLWTQHRSNGRSISLILLVNCFFQWESYPCLIIDCWYAYTEWYHKEQTDGQLHLTDHFSILHSTVTKNGGPIYPQHITQHFLSSPDSDLKWPILTQKIVSFRNVTTKSNKLNHIRRMSS